MFPYILIYFSEKSQSSIRKLGSSKADAEPHLLAQYELLHLNLAISKFIELSLGYQSCHKG